MVPTIKWAVNHMPKTEDKNLSLMSLAEAKKARAFHESFPQYARTPLTRLEKMAAYLGLKELYVKDESYRFGLNAFKVLGGSYAMARYIAKETGKDVSELPYSGNWLIRSPSTPPQTATTDAASPGPPTA